MFGIASLSGGGSLSGAPSVAAGGRTSTSTSAPPAVPASLVARPTGPVIDIYAAPGAGRPLAQMPDVWLLNGDPSTPIPQVFLVIGQPSGSWVQVLLAQRPNGTKGWVRRQSVSLLTDRYRIDVSIGSHTMSVHYGTSLLYQGPVATGAPATPTPLGEYYVRVLLRSPDPTSVYGPYAYGLSAHSDALTTFSGGDAEIGLHGNNDASALGHSVTHGCVRMDNAEISALARILPLGTPVNLDP